MATKRDFVAVAAIIKRQAHEAHVEELNVLGRVARDLAAMYRADNGRFQSGRFFEACGLTVNGDSWA